ncbi:MAG: M48 family metallopeptidase [Chitinophagaceae bacterium]|nr:M48 family metallopeptidase [Chitinophagaceae bacterium]MCB9047118.1 M48 family metallopeptidase [Chitinophagales bacterium]
MKKQFIIVFAALVSTAFTSCFKNPVTGRNSVNILPESEVMSLSKQEYTSYLAENKPISGTKDAETVKRVGAKMQVAVGKYLQSIGKQSLTNGYIWEFNLVNDNTANAFCMPGGKVVFNSGIMPLCANDAGVAVVMGHEIAHAIARHGNERMSQGLITQLGGMALSAAIANKPEQTKQIYNRAYGITTQVGVILPYSRAHESEADRMGLIFMAMAGYDPNEAISFWMRMAAAGGQKPPELLSTHPSDETRINDLRKHLPEAMKYYKPN